MEGGEDSLGENPLLVLRDCMLEAFGCRFFCRISAS